MCLPRKSTVSESVWSDPGVNTLTPWLKASPHCGNAIFQALKWEVEASLVLGFSWYRKEREMAELARKQGQNWRMMVLVLLLPCKREKGIRMMSQVSLLAWGGLEVGTLDHSLTPISASAVAAADLFMSKVCCQYRWCLYHGCFLICFLKHPPTLSVPKVYSILPALIPFLFCFALRDIQHSFISLQTQLNRHIVFKDIKNTFWGLIVTFQLCLLH